MDKNTLLKEKTLFLASLGSPIRSNKEFERAVKKALGEVQDVLFAIEHGIDVRLSDPFTKEEKIRAIELAKANAIRPVWLTTALDEWLCPDCW
jgi:hypothetical protein